MSQKNVTYASTISTQESRGGDDEPQGQGSAYTKTTGRDGLLGDPGPLSHWGLNVKQENTTDALLLLSPYPRGHGSQAGRSTPCMRRSGPGRTNRQCFPYAHVRLLYYAVRFDQHVLLIYTRLGVTIWVNIPGPP